MGNPCSKCFIERSHLKLLASVISVLILNSYHAYIALNVQLELGAYYGTRNGQIFKVAFVKHNVVCLCPENRFETLVMFVLFS